MDKNNKEKDIKTKEEMNLVEYPFQYLKYKVPPDVKTVEWHGETTTKDGTVRKASWVVTGSDRYGLPRYKDRDVLLALLYYWKLQGFQSERLCIDSVVDILRLLKWDTSSKGYKELKESLNRLVGITVVAEYAFWDNKIKDYLPYTVFHILDLAEFNKEGKRYILTVKASEKFWESIKNNYIKTVDLDFYLSLETPVAKALYSYLDKKAYQNDNFNIELIKLASHLGISTNQAIWHIKAIIKEASDILLSKGFLDCYLFKKEGKEEYITFYFNKEYLTREFKELVSNREERIKYIVDIMKREIGEDSITVYEKIAREFPEEFIYRALGEIREKERSGKLIQSKLRLLRRLLKSYVKKQIEIIHQNLG